MTERGSHPGRRAPLPVDAVLPQVVRSLQAGPAVIVTAPPGSGKTTRVPPALLDAGVADGKVLLLQPRRAAARLVARRIAWERGSRVGAEVGYSVRFDRKTSRETRLEVLTEGLLTRRMQADPFLAGVGVVVLDEVHERSIHTDLALALLVEVIHEAREDLKLVVMSATLDPGPLQAFLGPSTPVVRAEGRTFPVDVDYQERPDDRRLGARVAAAVRSTLALEDDGHVLVFLPGVREIRWSAEALGPVAGVDVLPLHGRLPPAAQDRALGPSARRKVVLSTNLAETSVTLDGVRVVIDSGLARVPVHDVASGLTRLETRPISRAAADQRAGRAGRTGPGRCLRLWTINTHNLRSEFRVPEIQRSDLASLVLEVLAWGRNPADFRWFESPPAAAVTRAMDLLAQLGAVREGVLTPLGRDLASIPLHPRLGRVVLAGHAAGCLRAAAGAAALATEPDPWARDRGELRAASEDDLLGRLARLDGAGDGADPRALARVRKVRDQLMRAVGRGCRGDPADPAVLDALVLGFPDRVGLRRAGQGRRYQLAGGPGGQLQVQGDGSAPACLIAIGLEGQGRGSEALIRLAAPLDPARLPATESVEVAWDGEHGGVVARRILRFGALVLRTAPADEKPDPVAAARLLAAHAARDPDRCLAPSEDARALQARVAFLRRVRPELMLPDLSDLCALLPELCEGLRSLRQLRALDLPQALRSRLDWKQRQSLDRLAPARLTLPTGHTAAVAYGAPDQPPVVRARIQQMFGCTQNPRIAGETVVLHLLAPNNRPAQVTADLAGFWAGSYADVRKELRGRYPKHAWPEDPVSARPEDSPRRRR